MQIFQDLVPVITGSTLTYWHSLNTQPELVFELNY
jgi:hypothetical protein